MNCEYINGYRVTAFIDKKHFLTFIGGRKVILIAMNAEKLLKKDDRLRAIINKNVGYTDGIGAVIALKLKGLEVVKIPGVEFWLDIIGAFYLDKRFYFVGSSGRTIDKTVAKLKADYPMIEIAGYRNGYLGEGDKEKLIEDMLLTKPDIVFIAQGSPRQEYLMEELMKYYPALYMGLGGSFDVYCGEKKRAPFLYQKLGLEWFYRLLKEPTRIKRQLVLLNFVYRLLMKKL